MIEQTTRKPISLNVGDRGHASIHLLASHMTEVKDLLTNNGVNFWVCENYFSRNSGPEYGHIYLGIKTDIEKVRALLDSIHT
ncbi:MAG: hypothetical protein EXS16_04990 [Gemmataceae bacterium]|nr:hypothetical protein [Gemmataceae bacterium]